MVQFTNNDGMCNDPFYVNVNLAQTTHRGLRPLLFTNSVWVLQRPTEFIIEELKQRRRHRERQKAIGLYW